VALPAAGAGYVRPMEIQGRIAVVTGAAGGIGGALVRALLDAGARAVVAADLSLTGVDAGDDARILPRVLDVTDGAATQRLVDEIEHALGPVDLWFANAGLAGGGGPEAPDETWQRQWDVNLMAHVHATRALLPGWLARGEGHLVTTASMAGILTSLGDGVYAATKHAAVGYAEWLAITYGDRGVRVTCVCPGAVDTPMLRGGAGGDADRAAAVIGGGDVLDPAEAARRIVVAVEEDRVLVYTHPDMHDLVVRKAQDPERWVRGMRRLWARAQLLLEG
jgi:NAD(P)-dependent dehydrogenase (short-subunit alcohol dehydrogenase family)